MTPRHLEIVPLSRHRWVLRYEDDPTPISEHPTQTDAVTEARNWARQFGATAVHVHELDGELRTDEIRPDFPAPTPADVKGPSVEPG